MSKIWRILRSRFLKDDNNPYAEERISICLDCPFNSINTKEVNLKQKLLIKLSNLYTVITLNKPQKFGNCLACESCDVYYKCIDAEDKTECPKNKWKN